MLQEKEGVSRRQGVAEEGTMWQEYRTSVAALKGKIWTLKGKKI